MRRFIPLIAILIFAPTLRADDAPKKIVTVEGVTEYRLANGARVLLFPEASRPTVTVNLTVPVWDWGGLRSKVHQSETRERQAKTTLSQAQRQLLSNLYSRYNETLTARTAADNLRRIVDLASESLRLITLRYEAGESTALEIVDAQNTLLQARNAADDAEVRYRVAVAELQMITGTF